MTSVDLPRAQSPQPDSHALRRARPARRAASNGEHFTADRSTALEAIEKAQQIAFAPYVFQASVILRDKGLLAYLHDHHSAGSTTDELQAYAGLSHYAMRVLLEAALGIGLAYRREGRYYLTKAGYFFQSDQTTRINTDFMRDVCYDGAKDMQTALEEGRPAGLRHLGDWATLYEGLSILPQPARDSWFAFDHYYSDNAFPEALPMVFATGGTRILDIGGNTGRFAATCLGQNPDAHVGLVDLQVQLNVAADNLSRGGFDGRYDLHAINMLDPNAALPQGYEVIWMSQFLSCFADHEIVHILKRCHAALPDGGRAFINETFWDLQQHESAAFSLQMTSLYFTTIANGNSQMYDSKVFEGFIREAGFEIAATHRNIGLSHTVLELVKA